MGESLSEVKHELINTYTHLHIYSVFSTVVEKTLQIALFMQNKANFKNDKINVSSYLTSEYENFSVPVASKNKAKQSQSFRLSAGNAPERDALGGNSKCEALNTNHRLRICFSLSISPDFMWYACLSSGYSLL